MKRIIALGAVVVLVLALWGGAWLFFAGEIRRNVEALAQADGVSTPRLTCGNLSVGGFPFRFDVVCSDLAVLSGDLTAAMPVLQVSALVYRPTHVLAFPQGPLEISDAFTGSRSRVAWSEMEASGRLEGWRIGRISLTGKDVALTDALFGDALIASAASLEAHLLDIPERHEPQKGLAALAAYATAGGVQAPGFAVNAGETSLEAEVIGLPDDVRVLGEPDAVRRWQQAGGKVQVTSFKGSDAERFFSSDGTLGLDDQARLEGRLRLTSKGLVEFFSAQIPEPMRPLVLGPQGADGSYAQTLDLRAGVLLAGVVPLAMLPPLF